ncbi:hypothetical protein UFOVP1351_16 [uncultured Caudovirales phage]|uniref:Uncharacterized protein n=1 Tax=uncultured Caudovirales phage TaxID=2100421 RepID=A0A6J5S154_9CAUD|nr:hypothetical protein UFOVP1351_16 [uncultured Caudovirales phage]
MSDANNTAAAPVEASQAPVDNAPEVNAEASKENQPAQEAPKPRNVKKLKLKVDGQELEEEIDLDDEENLKRHLQMSKAAQKRMSEAAKAKRDNEELAKVFKGPVKDLFKYADALGKTPQQLRQELEEYFAAQLEEEMLTPEQKKVRDAEQIIREREEEKRRAKEQEEAAEKEHWQKHYAQEYDKKITEALSSSGLPKTPKTVHRMASLMSKNLEMGLDLEPKHLVDIVREEYLTEIKELFGASDGDTLLKMLGDDVANKIRKSDLARLKGAGIPQKKVASQPAEQPKPQRRMTTEEWLAEVRRRAREG